MPVYSLHHQGKCQGRSVQSNQLLFAIDNLGYHIIPTLAKPALSVPNCWDYYLMLHIGAHNVCHTMSLQNLLLQNMPARPQ